jgi:hypothetical protein
VAIRVDLDSFYRHRMEPEEVVKIQWVPSSEVLGDGAVDKAGYSLALTPPVQSAPQ